MIKLYLALTFLNWILYKVMENRIRHIFTLSDESKEKIKNNEKNELHMIKTKKAILLFVPVLHLLTFFVLIFLTACDYDTFKDLIEGCIEKMEG